MPFQRDTLTKLRQQGLADLDAAFPADQGRLRFSVPGVLVEVLAGMVNAQYGYQDYIARQGVPFTSTNEYLQGWGNLKNTTLKAATRSKGTLRFAAGGDASIPAGTAVVRADGLPFTVVADVFVTGGYAYPVVEAVDAGGAANTDVGATFLLSSAIAGVAASGVAYTDITGGAGVQSQDSYRADVLAAYARVSGGGTPDDYEVWARQVSGVTRAWAERGGMGAGTVVVRIMLDEANSGEGGFPIGDDGVSSHEYPGLGVATGDQLRVADYVFTLQPADAVVYVTAPVANTVDFTIVGLGSAPTTVRNAIEAAISGLFYDLGKPGGVIDLSAIDGAIDSVPGSAGFVITVMTCTAGEISPAGRGNVASHTGAIAILGNITWGM